MNIREILLFSLLGLTSCASTNNHIKQDTERPRDIVQTSYDKKEQVKLEDRITQKEIEALMERGSVDEILREEFKAGTIDHLVYNPEKPEESAEAYKRFVFQEHLKSEERKPVLVLVYDDTKNKKDLSRDDPNKRAGIITKGAERKYGEKMKILAFRVDIEDVKSAAPYGETLKKHLKLPINCSPTHILFGSKDLSKKERQDDEIESLDLLAGGPKTNKAILNWLYEGETSFCEWLETNVINPNGHYLLRLNNSANPKKVWYAGK